MSSVVFIGLGSNLGDRAALLSGAVERLRATPGIGSVTLSRVHETEPVGGPSGQGRYLNAVAQVETTLEPHALLAELRRIETGAGRERRERWGPRTLDLDLLLYDDRVIDSPDLTVPHPRLHERRFVLEPLAELAPELVHPVLRRTITELLAAV